MATYEIPNSTAGIDGILIDIVNQVPSLTIMFSIFVFFFVFLTGMSLQSRRSGVVDMPLWSTLALLSVVMLNLIFSLTAGIVDPIVLGVSVSLTFFSGLWLFLSRGRFEN